MSSTHQVSTSNSIKRNNSNISDKVIPPKDIQTFSKNAKKRDNCSNDSSRSLSNHIGSDYKRKRFSTVQFGENNEYVVAIPSYNRPEIIQMATLSLLEKHLIEPGRVHIFVANADQLLIYKNQLQKKWHDSLKVAVLGIKNVRNFMTRYFASGTKIFYLDDDIYEINQCFWDEDKYRKKGASRKVYGNFFKPLQNLDRFICEAFEECEKKHVRMFGVNAVCNPFFSTPCSDEKAIKKGLYFTVGACYGCINDTTVNIVSIDDKDDYERTIRYYLSDGAVLRFSSIAIKTRYYTEPGGMQSPGQRSWQKCERDGRLLLQMYPDLVSINENSKKKDKLTKKPYLQVRLRDKRKK